MFPNITKFTVTFLRKVVAFFSPFPFCGSQLCLVKTVWLNNEIRETDASHTHIHPSILTRNNSCIHEKKVRTFHFNLIFLI